MNFASMFEATSDDRPVAMDIRRIHETEPEPERLA